MLVNFIQQEEKRFGKLATKPTKMRLPKRCFLDFSTGGAVCQIFSILYGHKFKNQWETFNFEDSSYIQISNEIFDMLIEQKRFRLPNVFIKPEVEDHLRKQITGIFKVDNCEVTENEDDATHIIYPEVELPDNYARPLFKRGKHVMMHWYYLPESYDTWNTIEKTFNLPVSTRVLCHSSLHLSFIKRYTISI